MKFVFQNKFRQSDKYANLKASFMSFKTSAL